MTRSKVLNAALMSTASMSFLSAAVAGPVKAQDGDRDDKKPAEAQVDEVVVVGSRLARTSDGPAPVIIIGREEIDRIGATTVSDLLKYLPQQSFNTQFNRYLGGAQTAQLRGLAVGSTLVLVNGRRSVPGGNILGGFFDINTIPIAAVERIEILSDSASAVYGSDAVGGVINIILKSSARDPVLDLSYGSADGGGEERRASLTIGGESGRAQGLMVLDYFRRDALFGRERDIVANADYRRFGGNDLRSLLSSPGNICAVSGNLPGLSTPCAAVPAGSSGVGLVPADFFATAGQTNFSARDASRAFVNPSETYSALTSGTFDLTDSVTAFGELGFIDRRNDTVLAYSGVSNALVPAANPYNPFGVPVRANFLLTDRNPTQHFDERSIRQVAGLEGQGRGWDWELSFAGVQADLTFVSADQLDTARLNAALAAANPELALNVFGNGFGGSDTLLRSLRTLVAETVTSDAYQVGGFARGDIFELPAGPLKMVIGGEWRTENFALIPLSLDGDRDSYAGYIETRIPVLGPSTDIPLLRDLALTLAGRYDHYSDFGGTMNGQYGAEWRPHNTLLIRASYGESYRAPTLFNLFLPATVDQNVVIFDPARNEQVPVSYTTGGNPDLQPETSTSLSVGTIWSPNISGAPRLSVSYWQIKQDSRLSNFSHTAILANEGIVPADRVTRAAQTPADIAAGRPGRLIAVDIRGLNQGTLDVAGVDVEATAAFSTPLGRISPRISATYTAQYEAQDFPSSPVVDAVGLGSFNGSIPRWKAVGSLAWDRDGVSVSGTARYTPSYDDAAIYSSVRNGRTVDSQMLVDFQVAMDLEEVTEGRSQFLNGLSVRAGVTNLFDKEPPFSAVWGWGFDPSHGDFRQRFIYGALSKAF